MKNYMRKFSVFFLTVMTLVCIRTTAADALQTGNGIVGSYSFDEGAGTVLKDKSGKKNDGRIVGAVWVKGERGAALDFGGVTDHVECQDDLLTHFRGPMTVLVWVRSNLGTSQYLVGRGGDWQLSLAAGGAPVFITQNAGDVKTTRLNATQKVLKDQWAMLAGVYDTDRKVMEIYVNGELSGSTPKSDGAIGGIFRSKLLLGNNFRGLTGLDGLMCETRLYSRALSADEIREIYRTTRPADSIKIPACRLRLTLHLFCRERKLHAQLNLRNPHPNGGVRVQVALFNAGGKTPLAEGIVENLAAVAENVHEFDLSGLKPGGYEVRATAFSAADRALLAEVIQPFTLPERERWNDAKEVLSDKAPPPWTPLRVQTDQPADPQLPEAQINVFSWGRTYTFGAHPLPEQIRTADRAILAEPIRLSGRVDGRNVKWIADFPVVDSQTDAKVVLSMKASDPALTLTTKATIEFDGLMRFDCTLRPAKKALLENLVLEIPLRREHAQLVYYYRDKLFQASGSVPTAGVARSFNPAIWLGTEDYGLQWFTESDRNWYVADANRAIEIVPEGDKVVLRLNLVTLPITLDPGTRQTETTAPQLTYTFGLQATPVKPVTRDAWDLRTTATSYAILTRKIAGKPALDYYAEKGVKTVFLTSAWTGIFGYPGCVGHEDELRRMVKACHERGISVIVYLGSYFSDLAPEFPAYLQDFVLWNNPRHYSTFSLSGETQMTYLTCNGSDSWRDFILAGAERLMDEFDLDGFYLDGLGVAGPCHNVHHGCGYVKPDGSTAPTIPLFACRETLRRLQAIVKSRKPDGIIDFHPAAYRLSAVLSFIDNVWDGEAILGPIRRQDRKSRFLTEYLPLDLFRGQILGRPWGSSAEFLGYTVPCPYKQLWAMTLLHDIPIRPIGGSIGALQLASQMWGAMDAFDRKGAEWLPYWKNSNYVSVQPSGAYVSLYRHPKNGVLAVVSNLGKETVEARVRFNIKSLGLSAQTTAVDALTGEAVPLTDGEIAIRLESIGWRLIRLTK